jgi:hypothetical protein
MALMRIQACPQPDEQRPLTRRTPDSEKTHFHSLARRTIDIAAGEARLKKNTTLTGNFAITSDPDVDGPFILI